MQLRVAEVRKEGDPQINEEASSLYWSGVNDWNRKMMIKQSTLSTLYLDGYQDT